MNKLPEPVCTHIYDFLSGDADYWKTEFDNVIQYLDKYSDDVIYDVNRFHIYNDEDYTDIFIFNILNYYL